MLDSFPFEKNLEGYLSKGNEEFLARACKFQVTCSSTLTFYFLKITRFVANPVVTTTEKFDSFYILNSKQRLLSQVTKC